MQSTANSLIDRLFLEGRLQFQTSIDSDAYAVKNEASYIIH